MRALAYGTDADYSRTVKTGIANDKVEVFLQTRTGRIKVTLDSDGDYTVQLVQGQATLNYGFNELYKRFLAVGNVNDIPESEVS